MNEKEMVAEIDQRKAAIREAILGLSELERMQMVMGAMASMMEASGSSSVRESFAVLGACQVIEWIVFEGAAND